MIWLGLFPVQRQALMRGQHARRHEPESGKVYAFLLDVAGEEEDAPPGGLARAVSPKRDATALTVVEVDSSTVSDPLLARPTYRTVDRRLWIGAKHSTLYGTLVDLVARWNPRWLVIDATGAGSGLASFLQAALRQQSCARDLQRCQQDQHRLGLRGHRRDRPLQRLCR